MPRLTLAILAAVFIPGAIRAGEKPLFDGKTLAGWEGDTAKTWRVEDGAIVGGSLETAVPRNEFLCTTKSGSGERAKRPAAGSSRCRPITSVTAAGLKESYTCASQRRKRRARSFGRFGPGCRVLRQECAL